MMNSENCDDFKLLYIGNCLIFGSRGKLFEKSLFSVKVLRRIGKRLMALITYITLKKFLGNKGCYQKNIKFSCYLLLLFNGGNWGGADGG